MLSRCSQVISRRESGASHIGATLLLVCLCLGTMAVSQGAAVRKGKQVAWPSAQRSHGKTRRLLAIDPGPRPGPSGAGNLIKGLSNSEVTPANLGKTQFQVVHNVTGTGEIGLGPRFDSNSCASCHAQPATGGSSPSTNPLFAVYTLDGGKNSMPTFEATNGPALTARFPYQSDLATPDGNVHQLFVISGRADAGACSITQPDFATAQAENNLVFRQPSPIFGVGLVELILDSDILINMGSNATLKQQLGISGHTNVAEDGSIARFGWKAQNRSAIITAFEQFNVEMGVTSEDLPNELDETPGCTLNPIPEDHTNFTTAIPMDFPGDSERLAIFMRFLDQPTPAKPTQSTLAGQVQFNNIGCVLCHTTSFTTPGAGERALGNILTNLYSDLLVHHMGPCLADNIVQGTAQGDEFRTAPLWGVGKRIFFLHDGRTSDIVQAVEDHFCTGNAQYPNSEANSVINSFNALSPTDQQNLINFLRSL